MKIYAQTGSERGEREYIKIQSPLCNLPDMKLKTTTDNKLFRFREGRTRVKIKSYPVYSPRHELTLQIQYELTTLNEGRTTTHKYISSPVYLHKALLHVMAQCQKMSLSSKWHKS